MRVKLAVLMLMALSLGLVAEASATDSGTFIWSGFTQKWGYNHRFSRQGDYIDTKSCRGVGTTCRADIVHTTASGIGPDTADANSYWWQVQAKNVGFTTPSAELEFKGSRGETIKSSTTVTVPVGDSSSAELRSRKNYVSLLNGFDLIAASESSKITKFQLATSSVKYDEQNRQLTFRISATARMLCSSAECSKTDNSVSYKLAVHTAVVAGDSEVAVSSKTFKNNYSWRDQARSLAGDCGVNYDPQFDTPGKEIEPDPIAAKLTGKRTARHAFLGFRSLAFQTTGEPHVLEFDSSILPGKYNGRSYSFNLNLFFKNWENGMQTSNKPFSLCSFAEPGAARWSANIALVQLSSRAHVTHKKSACKIKWPGLGKAPDDPLASCVRQKTFRLIS